MSLWFWQQYRAQRLGGSGRRLRGWAGGVRQRRGRGNCRGSRGGSRAVRGARPRVQTGCWATRPGVTWRGGAPQAGRPILGLGLQGRHLAPQARAGEQRPLLQGAGGTAPLGREGPWTPAEMPHGTALCLAGLGAGWTDRQTEMFGCRLFAYWLKATGNGNVFAGIKGGPCGGGRAQDHRS